MNILFHWSFRMRQVYSFQNFVRNGSSKKMYGFNSAKHLVTAAAPYAKVGQIFNRRCPAGINQIFDRRVYGRDMEKRQKMLSSNNSNSSYERKVLPPELSKSVAVLTCDSAAAGGVCDVYLVGTCHVSKESCEEVRAVIEFLKPQVVFLERCHDRSWVLRCQSSKMPSLPTMGEIVVDMFKKKQNLFAIVCGLYTQKVASLLDVQPGAEFRVAYEEAVKCGGKVILGDQPVEITLQRTWAMMPLGNKIKLLYMFLFGIIYRTVKRTDPEDLAKKLKEMNNVDKLTQRISKVFPTLMKTLVHEGDQYMSAKLLKEARNITRW